MRKIHPAIDLNNPNAFLGEMNEAIFRSDNLIALRAQFLVRVPDEHADHVRAAWTAVRVGPVDQPLGMFYAINLDMDGARRFIVGFR